MTSLLFQETFNDILGPLEAKLVVSAQLKESTLILEAPRGDAMVVEERYIPAALKALLEAALFHAHLPLGTNKTAKTGDSPFSAIASKEGGDVVPLSLNRGDIRGARVAMSVQGAFWFAQVLTAALTRLNANRERAEGTSLRLAA